MTKDKTAGRSGVLNPFVELIWGRSGIGELLLFGQAFTIEPGDVFYYLPGEDHTQRTLSPEWQYRYLCFDGPFAQAIMLSYNYPRLLRFQSEYPEAAFREIETLITESDPLGLRRLCGLVLEVLAHAGGASGEGAHSGKVVRLALTFIQKNMANPQLGVDMICQELDIPPSTLNQFFRNELGCSPGRHILNRRLMQAQALLLGTNLPVKKVAERCGFNDPLTFSRFIKRTLGHSPRNLRQTAAR